MTDAPALLPCPFCATDRPCLVGRRVHSDIAPHPWGAQIGCRGCNALMERVGKTPEEARDAVVAMWNRRTAPTAAADEADVERVAEAISQEWLWLGALQREHWRKKARLAIAAMRKPAEAETWIKCIERMPENGSLVLTADQEDESITEVRYYDADEYEGGWAPPSTWVTHWMPLPEPPKEKA